MNTFNAREYVELFHLLFMEQLSHKLDRRVYALKGGCNLRFFLKSIRYSEDIDIDIHTTSPNTLTNIVQKILASLPFQHVLSTNQISIINSTSPKQTSTTQRWKIQLAVPTLSLPLNTKVEFSRRKSQLSAELNPVDQNLIRQYQCRPMMLSHYSAQDALIQKVEALIYRSETQARDVFDIFHLLQSSNAQMNEHFKKSELKIAQENAIGIQFSDFKSQVVSYLQPEYQKQYNDALVWNKMVETVMDQLEKKVQ
jgi:predicted nucleotidyltransferase component of viral defense system